MYMITNARGVFKAKSLLIKCNGIIMNTTEYSVLHVSIFFFQAMTLHKQ